MTVSNTIRLMRSLISLRWPSANTIAEKNRRQTLREKVVMPCRGHVQKLEEHRTPETPEQPQNTGRTESWNTGKTNKQATTTTTGKNKTTATTTTTTHSTVLECLL